MSLSFHSYKRDVTLFFWEAVDISGNGKKLVADGEAHYNRQSRAVHSIKTICVPTPAHFLRAVGLCSSSSMLRLARGMLTLQSLLKAFTGA